MNNRYEIVVFGEKPQDESIVNSTNDMELAICLANEQQKEACVFDTVTNNAIHCNNFYLIDKL